MAGIVEAGTYPIEITFSLPAGYVVKSYSPITVKVSGHPIEEHLEETEENPDDESYLEDEKETEDDTEDKQEETAESEASLSELSLEE